MFLGNFHGLLRQLKAQSRFINLCAILNISQPLDNSY